MAPGVLADRMAFQPSAELLQQRVAGDAPELVGVLLGAGGAQRRQRRPDQPRAVRVARRPLEPAPPPGSVRDRGPSGWPRCAAGRAGSSSSPCTRWRAAQPVGQRSRSAAGACRAVPARSARFRPAGPPRRGRRPGRPGPPATWEPPAAAACPWRPPTASRPASRCRPGRHPAVPPPSPRRKLSRPAGHGRGCSPSARTARPTARRGSPGSAWAAPWAAAVPAELSRCLDRRDVRQRPAAGPALRDRVGHRPAAEMPVELVEAVHHGHYVESEVASKPPGYCFGLFGCLRPSTRTGALPSGVTRKGVGECEQQSLLRFGWVARSVRCRRVGGMS